MIYRISADYFPAEVEGNSWEFESTEGMTVLLVSFGKATKGQRECVLIERNYAPEYWYENSAELARYEIEHYDFQGQRIEFNRWLRYLELPLLVGNSWSDTLDAVEVVSGERVERRVVSYGKAEAIETVKVQAGTFRECYKVSLVRERETFVNFALRECDTIRTCEWYAPDVGLVKFVENGEEYSLVRLALLQ